MNLARRTLGVQVVPHSYCSRKHRLWFGRAGLDVIVVLSYPCIRRLFDESLCQFTCSGQRGLWNNDFILLPWIIRLPLLVCSFIILVDISPLPTVLLFDLW